MRKTAVCLAESLAGSAVRCLCSVFYVGLLLMSAACSDAEDDDSASTAEPSDDSSPAEPSDADSDASPVQGTPLEGLRNLAFEIDGTTVRLSDGRYLKSYGGASQDVYELQEEVALGDLDGDGDDDVVVHIINTTGGTGVFHMIVAVFHDDGELEAGPVVPLGDRVVVEEIAVRNGLVDVVRLDREDDEAFTVISRRTTLEIDFGAPEPRVRVIAVEPLEDPPSPPSR